MLYRRNVTCVRYAANKTIVEDTRRRQITMNEKKKNNKQKIERNMDSHFVCVCVCAEQCDNGTTNEDS